MHGLTGGTSFVLLSLPLQKTGDVRLQLQAMQQELEGARADLAARREKLAEQQQQLDAKNAAVEGKVNTAPG